MAGVHSRLWEGNATVPGQGEYGHFGDGEDKEDSVEAPSRFGQVHFLWRTYDHLVFHPQGVPNHRSCELAMEFLYLSPLIIIKLHALENNNYKFQVDLLGINDKLKTMKG